MQDRKAWWCLQLVWEKDKLDVTGAREVDSEPMVSGDTKEIIKYLKEHGEVMLK